MSSLYDIVKKPIITEASMAAMDEKKYTFEVDSRAHKLLIKQAVEAVFDVKVASVNTTTVKPKAKRVGRYTGFKPGYKKAIVTLTADSKNIDIFGEDAE
ncbi:50S ribosomal protein L23 [Lactococcus termiticola]|uniref:Large ribosomal subunit protein uL23 n=1 Tax=Lactococcus termiticola TaxID=2169526 RepID=A0A2R5HDL1_9LACT|nr:50S ribosomal protein L23 [Lactococcus termiticola]GBG96157.1 50S ribosomal protein L23 [Lactococcus termiticola]